MIIQEQENGQGLLETIIAIGILMSGLFSVFSLAVGNFNSQREGSLRLQALNLAREGLETVRNIRDTNWLKGQDAWTGIVQSDDFTAQVIFDESSGDKTLDFTPDSLSAAPIYFKNGLCKQYEPGSEPEDSQATPFHRLLIINPINCLDELSNVQCGPDSGLPPTIGMEVNSQVSWSAAGRTSDLTLTEKIYDWR